MVMMSPFMLGLPSSAEVESFDPKFASAWVLVDVLVLVLAKVLTNIEFHSGFLPPQDCDKQIK